MEIKSTALSEDIIANMKNSFFCIVYTVNSGILHFRKGVCTQITQSDITSGKIYCI